MKKNILLTLIILSIFIFTTHAYNLNNKDQLFINNITLKIEKIISKKWEKYRNLFINKLTKYSIKYRDTKPRYSEIFIWVAENITIEAIPKKCYLWMEVPSDLMRFSKDSPWRQKILSTQTLDSNSDAMIANLKKILTIDLKKSKAVLNPSIQKWSSPVHIIDSDNCELFDVQNENWSYHDSIDPDRDWIIKNIPIPKEIWAEPEVDWHTILIDLNKRKVREFSRFQQLSNWKYQASTAAIWDLDSKWIWKAFDWKTWYRQWVNGAGTSYFGWMITFEEMKAWKIEHVLAVSTPANRKKMSKWWAYNSELCADVATRTDGWGIGPEFILEGQKIQLNPDLDLDKIGLSENAKIIARALQEYWAYVMDNARWFNLIMQNMDSDWSGKTWIKDFSDVNLFDIPLDEFRVLSCDNVMRK